MYALSALLGVSALLQVVHFAHSKVDCEARISACSGRAWRPVCGSDNQTYPSRCILLRQHCASGAVTVRHRGHCKEQKPCYALKQDNQGLAPKCLGDGRYAPVQCHASSGWCWCVTPEGEPLAHTSIRHARPRCNRRRGQTKRRSFSRENKHRKDCSRIDRSTFVTNLLHIFRNEYNQQPHVVMNSSEDTSETDRRVLDWKFNSLDVNGDLLLSQTEYAPLKDLVRKVVKPKRCSRSFSRQCDLDWDKNISKHEWVTCLGLDVNLLQESVVSLTGHLPYEEDVGDHKEEVEVSSDCLTDRQAVLDEMRTNNNEMYIPECTPDGRYQKVQCYRSTGYCWCVNEDSGNTIPGTSVKDNDPKCDAVQPISRPMKGCPEHRKQAFLRGLMDFLTHTMASQKSSNITMKDSLDMSQEEQIASWNFNALDTNKNKVLEKNEWKAFRSLISTHRKLRRCGKKLPRYCDINHDRKISLTEWLHCLNAQRPVADASVAPTPNPRRKGPNPLESYLKGDD